MTGILLFLLAFSPVQPLPGKHAPVDQEKGTRHRVTSVHHERGSHSYTIVDAIQNYLNRASRQQIQKGGGQFKLNSQLYRFYASRHFQTVWTKPAMVSELLAAIEAIPEDGLDPADYHIREIKELVSRFPLSVEQQAQYDLLLSDAFLTLASHLHFGKVDPEKLEPTWNLGDSESHAALETKLQHAIAAEHVSMILQELRPKNSKYGELKRGLARYREIAASGGWPAVPQGPKLQEGDKDSRVKFLRKRLEVTGELVVSTPDSSNVYKGELVEAVRQFQKHNGINADGVVGNATLKALNVPVERRIEQIGINLERYRWFLGDIGSTYIMVNIPDFTLQYVENGQNRWKTRVIVGKPYRETPIFKADMQYIIFNPQWVIPPTILDKDALPEIRKSMSYLDKKKLRIFDKDGKAVDPASVNWAQYSGKNFPYRLQQTAGDHGSLGRIKFMLPNKYIVYLHDTPSKELFDKNVRTFSSGCIRVEHPFDLAQIVLRDSVKWSASRIQAAINTGKTSTVFLPKRIPVFILYMTAVPEGDELFFPEDVYGRDDALLKALNLHVPELKPSDLAL
ncbi:MAG: murein L,D-transpeptidase [Chlorobium sp.]|nr:MAG: murein L,D-transpeptidase [Chlorobium sp.]